MDSSKERLRDVLRQCGLVDHVLRVLSATAQLLLTAATNKTVSLNAYLDDAVSLELGGNPELVRHEEAHEIVHWKEVQQRLQLCAATAAEVGPDLW